MNFGEMFMSAMASLLANKLRSFLTMLGILIGVASIISIVAVGNGGKRAVVNALSNGQTTNTIQIFPKELVVPGLPQPGQVLSVSQADLDIAQQFSGVERVDYTITGQTNVTAGTHTINASIDAGPDYLNALAQFQVIKGHMFQASDVVAARPVVLLSNTLAGKLFGSGNPVGGIVTIGGTPFQVIGVTASQQVNLFSLFLGSDYAYMPATTCQNLFPTWGITEMDVQTRPGVNQDELANHIVTALNVNAGDANAFETSTGFLTTVESTINRVTSILTLVIGAIAGIALLVGGVGVMNIMLVSVTERTQEIGIRMSLGATRTAILLQFLMESVMITAIGGLVGILLGTGVGVAVSAITHVPTFVQWPVVVFSFLFSAVIGVVCGLYPANKAARLNPIDALRYE
ncbi:putative ABC transporter permease YknZ [Alicyclobacillus acidoterrestris]|nr:putative ABC transporter permease YknZ [Alicyclobacillus acidoterrestris]